MKNRIVQPFALAFVLLCFAPTEAQAQQASVSAAESEAEIPEPLVFDLVRRLNSHKGEYEFNTLFRYEGTARASGLLYAPEFEYAFADGFAGELELPVADGKLDSIKVALQSKIGTIEKGKLEKGVQAIYEQKIEGAEKEISLLAINGFKFSHHLSVLTLIGPVAQIQGDATNWGILANGSVFYNNSREVDVALETNYRKVKNEPSELKLIPQLHLLFEKDVKFQFGIGAMLTEGEWLALSALRAIIEFN